jgi:predicted GH43/DUF377 family glycosyl hydrolase
VLKNGSTYMMWYQGLYIYGNGTRVTGLGLATSSDGVTWTKYSGNPVLTGSHPVYPWVLRIGDAFKMWYTCRENEGTQDEICYATSLDGIHWTENQAAVFQGTGSASDWDGGGVYSANVLYDGNGYGMWYTGYNAGGTQSQIGYATSTDGISWTRAPENPILGPSSAGAWDSYDAVENTGIIQVGGTFKLYYSADQGPLSSNGLPQSEKIGLAEAPAGFALTEFQNDGVTFMLLALLSVWITSVGVTHRNFHT